MGYLPNLKPQRKYGWRPDKPDQRDLEHPRISFFKSWQLPTRVDWTSRMPPVYDQGNLSSCTGNAIAAVVEHGRMKQGLKDFIPSRLFIYYNERALEGTISEDAGAEIRDGIKTVAKQGICPELEWPYIEDAFATKPTAQCYRDALKNIVKRYARVTQTVSQMRGTLAAGDLIVLGITIYETFEGDEVAATGVVPMPKTTEKSLGGHAVVLVGYDHPSRVFIARNSWGADWGMKGYFTIPYDYVSDSNLADDLWTIQVAA
jgi:C1A family cysteine protease